METNQVMEQKIMGSIIHATMFEKAIHLQELFMAGNKWRIQQGLSSRNVEDWLNNKATKELIAVVEEEFKKSVIKRKRGRNGGTYVHVILALDAAAWLSPKAKLEIYKVFIEEKVLEYRELGGDLFIDLNGVIKEIAPKLFGKKAHKGHYITISRIIRERLGVENWNLANPEQLKERARIERDLVKLLQLNLVKDWDHLKELAKIV